MSRRSPYDREILRLAVPALGALAAEPLYVLVDTAIVGHLGTRQLAALALAAAILSAATALCNFLAYGTTAQVARHHGAGQEHEAGLIGAQALWFALAIGAALLLGGVVLAGPATALMGGSGETARLAARYLRIAALGLPFAMIALAGQGYLRGVGDLRTPLVIVVVAQAVNIVLELWLVYGLDLGLDGSAIGTVIAQSGMAAAFVVVLLRAAGDAWRPVRSAIARLAHMGGHLFVRTASLLAAFVFCSAVLARVGESSLAAHQIAFQLFVFIALVLDAIAIAGQVIVGRMLGSGDSAGARAAAQRMLWWALIAGVGFAVVLLASRQLLPRVFTEDGAVRDRASALWPLFALMQPAAGVVFALDGILIGAGDSRYLAWSMVFAGFVVCVPLALAALHFGWGVIGVWAALDALMLARLATLGRRFAGGRWQVVGAPA